MELDFRDIGETSLKAGLHFSFLIKALKITELLETEVSN